MKIHLESNRTQLSNKIGMSGINNKARVIGKSELFYSKYSRFTFKALIRDRYQKFLNSMLELEEINIDTVESVKIEVYPARKKTGFGIAGKCNPVTGKICIYPKTEKFCYAFGEKYGKSVLIIYAGSRARASLIHELLHLKYKSDESKVRSLTRSYFSKFLRENSNWHLSSQSVCNLIFGRGK